MNFSDTRLWSVVVVKYVFHICYTWHFSCFMANMVVLYALTCYKLYALPHIECKLFLLIFKNFLVLCSTIDSVMWISKCGILVEESVLIIVNIWRYDEDIHDFTFTFTFQYSSNADKYRKQVRGTIWNDRNDATRQGGSSREGEVNLWFLFSLSNHCLLSTAIQSSSCQWLI